MSWTGAADLPRTSSQRGCAIFFCRAFVRRLEEEIRAQFQAFAATGIPLDHVNAQNHLHVHPTVLSLIIKVGREFDVRSIRIPYEPFWPTWRATRTDFFARLWNAVFLAPWLTLMRLRLRRAGISSNNCVIGMHDTGRMTASLVRAFVQHLPNGVCELYVHPATHAWPGAFPPTYDFAGEFQALIDPSVLQTVRASGIKPITFTELARAHGG